MKYLIKKILLILTFGVYLLSYHVSAQNYKIDGFLRDSKGPVSFSTIILSLDYSGDDVLSYTTSNVNGYFQLNVNRKVDSLWITIRSLNHATDKIQVGSTSNSLDILLTEKQNQLKEVIIKAKKDISIRGDTIRYDVDGLKKEKDYTIEEVISRIPGVQISDNGQIKYKEKAISHFYINGVDLLEGGYNVATRGIPAEAVEDIEVLQRHNHNRIDKGNLDSEEVAFNLKIKDNNKLLFGSGKADAGVPFFTGLAEFTPIYIDEDFQDIASLKANNIGKSLASNGMELTRGNQNLYPLKLPEFNILNKPDINGTSISDSYWLDNESLSATNNTLIKSSEDLILKVALAYNKGLNEIGRNSENIFFFGSDSTFVNTETKNNLDEELFHVGFSQEVNKDNVFISNKISFSVENDEGISSNIQNGNNLLYNYSLRGNQLTDLLEFQTKIGKMKLDNGFLVQYFDTQESSVTEPSVFESQIPSSFEAEQTLQAIEARQFNIGGYSSLNFLLAGSKVEIKQSLNWKSEKLLSDLQQESNELSSSLPFPYSSSFQLNTFEAKTTAGSAYDWGKFKFRIRPELNYLILDKEEKLAEEFNEKNDYLFFEPSLGIDYKYSNNWNFSLNGYRSINASRFPQLFNSLILRGFSSLYRNPNNVNVIRNNVGRLRVNYDNILSGFYIYNETSYSFTNSDFTIASSIDQNGLIEIEALDRPNTSESWNNKLSFSKRFFRILRMDLEHSFSYRLGEQFFNGVDQEFENTSNAISLDLNLDNNTWYSVALNTSIITNTSVVNSFENSNLFIKNKLELDFYTSSKSRINLTTESVRTSASSNDAINRNTLFDFSFFYKPSKKLFFRVMLSNLLNEDFFTTVQNTSNVIGQSQFSLRPRQLTIGLNYSL